MEKHHLIINTGLSIPMFDTRRYIDVCIYNIVLLCFTMFYIYSIYIYRIAPFAILNITNY